MKSFRGGIKSEKTFWGKGLFGKKININQNKNQG
jgi:hypothetical protein